MSFFKKNMLVAALFSVSAFAAHAADEGKGTVTFNGSIIDAPCSITPESAAQDVDLGQISNVTLANNGSSAPESFTITLASCDADTADAVTVTFNGSHDADANDLLALSGSASGAGIAIANKDGSPITLGSPSAAIDLIDGLNELTFTAYLKGTDAVGGVVPGDFSTVADFTLVYP